MREAKYAYDSFGRMRSMVHVVWRKSEGHRAKNAEHSKAWDKFFEDNPSPTKEQVIEFRDQTEQKVWGNTGDSPLQ